MLTSSPQPLSSTTTTDFDTSRWPHIRLQDSLRTVKTLLEGCRIGTGAGCTSFRRDEGGLLFDISFFHFFRHLRHNVATFECRWASRRRLDTTRHPVALHRCSGTQSLGNSARSRAAISCLRARCRGRQGHDGVCRRRGGLGTLEGLASPFDHGTICFPSSRIFLWGVRRTSTRRRTPDFTYTGS